MGLTHLYFSFSGRISRRTFWLKWIVPLFVLSLVVNVMLDARGYPLPPSGASSSSALLDGVGGLVMLVFAIVLIRSAIAIQVKRWHDRDKSGWWMLLNLIPAINLWPIIALGFLPSTPGPNKYGEKTDSVG